MALFHIYNTENILIRAILAGLLDILNNKINYTQAWADDDIEIIEVPWYYNQSGDERFMQDFYTHYAHCVPPKPVDGNIDIIPRGVITYTGSSIDEQRITSRFVQGTYVKENNNKLEQYVSFLYSIPLTIRIECEMWIDTQITSLKIEQEIREVFFKNVTFYVYYKGMRIGCTAGFPADQMITKNIQHSFDADKRIKLNFELEIESYQPVFDPTTEQLASNKMEGFAYRLYEMNSKNDGAIRITGPSENIIVPKGIPLWLEWSFTKEGGVMNKINIYWLNTGENERFDIALNQPNHEYFIWNIPEDFTSYIEPTIIWEENDNISLVRNPVLSIIPDLTTKIIDSSSFQIVENGYFACDTIDASIEFLLEMKDSDGNITYSPDGLIWANIKYNQIDSADPIYVDPSANVIYPETINYKKINIHIANTVNTDVYGILQNITIV